MLFVDKFWYTIDFTDAMPHRDRLVIRFRLRSPRMLMATQGNRARRKTESACVTVLRDQ